MEKRFHKGPTMQGKGIHLHPERLSIPLKRKTPTVYAVWNDLFHEAVPDDFVDKAFAGMALSERHEFLVLTKRADRMAKWFRYDVGVRQRVDRVSESCGDHFLLDHEAPDPTDAWPLQNTWMGLTVCNQEEADTKIPTFLKVPGKKFLSIEPMLGPVNLWNYLQHKASCRCPECHRRAYHPTESQLDSVILGGETVPGARPMYPEWVRSVRDQCAAAGVPFFFKQWGEWVPWTENDDHYVGWPPADPKRNHVWNESDRWYSIRVGRKSAGRLLDGRTHDDLPWAVPCA